MTKTNGLSTEELAQIAERCEKAAIGDWVYDADTNEINCGVYLIARDTEYEADAAFIANARQDIPKLLAEIERLWDIIEALSETPAWECVRCEMEADIYDED